MASELKEALSAAEIALGLHDGSCSDAPPDRERCDECLGCMTAFAHRKVQAQLRRAEQPQRHSVDRLAIPDDVRDAVFAAHWVNLEVRVGGETKTFEADWLKEYVIYGPRSADGAGADGS